MEGRSVGTYLNTRCAISTFKKNAESLLDVLSDQSRELLNDASLLHFFTFPDVPQNIPLLYRLILLYRPDKSAFLLGHYYVKLSVKEVAVILGIPNVGIDFNFRRLPLSSETQAELVTQLIELTNDEEDSFELETRRVDALVKYVLCRFLFPLKSLRIPLCLQKFGGLEEFTRYNWPKAIHAFLHQQFQDLHRLSCTRGEKASLGYLEGCSIILVVWFFEHTNIQVPMDPTAEPRLCRWATKGGWSQKFCDDLPRFLFQKKEVKPSLDYLSSVDEETYGRDDSESDFEEVLKLKAVKNNIGKFNKGAEETKDRENAQRMREKNKRERERRKRERVLKRSIKREIRESEKRIVSQLSTYFSEQFDSFLSKLTTQGHLPVVGTPTPPSPTYTLAQTTQKKSTGETICVSESTPNSKSRKRTRHSTKATVGSKEEIQFPGRSSLTLAAREIIDSTLSLYGERDCVVDCGNTTLTRGAMEDLLRQGWLLDSHIDAYAVVLNCRRSNRPKSWRNVLYVSPNHAHYKSCGASYQRLLEHITPANVSATDLIFMPVHLPGHWALLSCNLKEKLWQYYDSMPNSMHLATLPSLITSLQEDTRASLPAEIDKWDILPVREAPTQSGEDDCGIFILKYMEALASTKSISWATCKNWHKSMARFRGEIAAEMLELFASIN